jgi:cellulose synthase/poly-beta-1,6-N-acetylglucosamine synthase-like glycosyltransferase
MKKQWFLQRERYNNLSLSTSSYKSFSNRIFPTFLWFAEIYAKDYILNLLLLEANMRTVRDIVEDVKPTSPRSGNSANVVE